MKLGAKTLEAGMSTDGDQSDEREIRAVRKTGGIQGCPLGDTAPRRESGPSDIWVYSLNTQSFDEILD